MQRFNSLTLLTFAIFHAAIGGYIPKQTFSISDPDTIVRCFEQTKLNECAAKMDKIIRANRGGGRDDPESTLDNPFNLNKRRFDILCRGAKAFSGCVDVYDLKDLCSKDPLIVQLEGYLYQCSEPQKSGTIRLNLRYE